MENAKTLEIYEKVILAYSDEQAMAQIPKECIDDYTAVTIRTYKLRNFVADNRIVKNLLNKMELTIESVADFKCIYEEWHKSIELLTKLSLTLEDEWQEFGVEERVMRFANIENLYKSILGAMIDE